MLRIRKFWTSKLDLILDPYSYYVPKKNLDPDPYTEPHSKNIKRIPFPNVCALVRDMSSAVFVVSSMSSNIKKKHDVLQCLWIRDVYPGSWFLSISDFGFKNSNKLSLSIKLTRVLFLIEICSTVDSACVLWCFFFIWRNQNLFKNVNKH
jgi:hypothetical protein